MAAAGRVFAVAALLALTHTQTHTHGHRRPTEIYHVSAGHLLVLRCRGAEPYSNVTWSRAGMTITAMTSGLKVKDGLLLFLPLQTFHNGTYTCEKRGQRRSWEMDFNVLVSSSECPDPAEATPIIQGTSDGLPCKQKEIFRLNSTTHIRWLKDCSPITRREPNISVEEDGFIRLPAASESDAGKYTCLIDISLGGRKYTAARSFQVSIDNVEDGVLVVPTVMYPKQEVVEVKLGSRVELKCSAYMGFSEEFGTFMYWTVGDCCSETHPQLNTSWKYVHDEGRVYGLSTLSISEVLPQFLNVPIYCYVVNPAGCGSGFVWLQEADLSSFYTSLGLCLASSLAVLVLAAAVLFFKVELVLAYRKLLPHLAKQRAPDGKMYDAYVSFLHADTLGLAETLTFALQILPEVLEKQHGYSLYIRGRDDCPGEALHDAVAATMCKCRRLIIIVSAQFSSSTNEETDEMSALCDNQNKLCYEQKVGLYDALIQNDLRVILVEIDGLVDDSILPESLRYIKRKEGALIWRNASAENQKLSRSRSNRVFWKNLRYHMPSVPAGSLQTVN
ncbi:hypothetical protein LDENG_00083490 [Lucifuga dentata]|nr:hypothetical protein LDENG_00083490 [Lucifuga dentata]